jgi:hypothetical protein
MIPFHLKDLTLYLRSFSVHQAGYQCDSAWCSARAPMAPSQGPNVRGEQLVGITFAFTALAALFVILRCITRFGFARTWFVEDIAIICALVFSTAYTALVLVRKYCTLPLFSCPSIWLTQIQRNHTVSGGIMRV